MSRSSEPLGKPEWVLLFSILGVMPWFVSSVMHYALGIERVLSLSGGVDFLLVWLNSITSLSLISTRLTKQNLRRALLATVLIGLPWTLSLMPSEPLQVSLAVLLILSLFGLLLRKISVFRAGVVTMLIGVLTVAVVHHVLFIYQLHKPDTQSMQTELEQVVLNDHEGWSNGPCEENGWVLDRCLRFPSDFIGKYTNQPLLKPVIESMLEEHHKTNDRVVSGTSQDIDRAPHWALSFDGEYWQIAYWENGYYEFITFTLMVWLWVVAVTIWTLTWLGLIEWHQSTSAKDRKKASRKVAWVLLAIFFAHIAHLAVLSASIPRLLPQQALTQPGQAEVLTPKIQSFLASMIGISVVGWIMVVLLVVIGHLILFRIRRAKQNLS